MAVLAALAILTGFPAGVTGPACAGTSERVLVDPKTGLALLGFDPVGYFTEAKPVRGVAEQEWSYDGAVWRFRNEGNRAAFIAHPEVYEPRFGGYDPVDVSRGRSVESFPSLWLIVGQRLYLFSSEANRAAFGSDPARYLGAAERRWPALRDALAQ